ncbi:chromate efflux transporter [Herbaspirillum sp. NPDC101397]|uniref:chromate efflux transporter n=1 Tax=Herbaspirillum sp. NPDC101397 TaxID=3364006 RepID=UPI00383ACE7E
MNSLRNGSETVRLFFVFLKLGLTAFGGPVAHLGYFRQEFVVRRNWFSEQAYADIVALCQFLPGPASSQVGMAVGISRAGIPGAIAAFMGFTLPSALALVLFAIGLSHFSAQLGVGWIHGLKVVAVSVVAQALWGMSRTLAPDMKRAVMAGVAAAVVLTVPSSIGQVAAIAIGGLYGFAFLATPTAPHDARLHVTISRTTGIASLFLFIGFLIILPIIAEGSGIYALKLFSGFYRAGALVFGGGHVVLPLLQAEVVPAGWVSNDAFLAGYGAVQAVPGPLFTFATFLGAISSQTPNGWTGAAIATFAIFLPAFLLIVAFAPFWESLRRYGAVRRAMLGINAAVVGILLAAFYNPVWSNGIRSWNDFWLGLAAFLLLAFGKWPPWLVVLCTAVAAGLLSA